MADPFICVGDFGTAIKITIRQGPKKSDPVVNLTGATSVLFEVRKPDPDAPDKGQTIDVAWTGMVDGDPLLGVTKYVTIVGDIDVPGRYIVQPKITFPAGVWRAFPIIVVVKDRFGQ